MEQLIAMVELFVIIIVILVVITFIQSACERHADNQVAKYKKDQKERLGL